MRSWKKTGHAFDVARADAAVGDVAVNILLGCRGIAVELPDFLQLRNLSRRPRGLERFKGIHDAIAAAENDERLPVNFCERGRGPGAVKNPWANVLVVFRHEAAGVFVEHNEAGRVGRANLSVRIVHAVGGVDVEELSVHEDRSVGLIVLPHAAFLDVIEEPENVRVVGGDRGGLFADRHRMTSLVEVRAIVAVGHAEQVQAHHLAAIADQIDVVALDRGRRADAGVRPIPVNAVGQFRDDELPEEVAGLLVQTQEDAAVALVFWIARLAVVRADEDTAASNDGRGMGFGSQWRRPFDVPPSGGVE